MQGVTFTSHLDALRARQASMSPKTRRRWALAAGRTYFDSLRAAEARILCADMPVGYNVAVADAHTRTLQANAPRLRGTRFNLVLVPVPVMQSPKLWAKIAKRKAREDAKRRLACAA